MRDLAGVPALTVMNPWGALITHGTKRIENRSWEPPTSLTRFLVHAGKGWDAGAGRIILDNAATVDKGTTSAIVAVADLDRICNISRRLDHIGCGCGEWSMPGQYHWVLTNVIVLPDPVLCSGRQKLWWPDPKVVAAVAEQVATLVVGRA